MEYITIGKINNTFGIKGELKVESYTDFVSERFKKNSTIYIGEDHLPFEVKSCRDHNGILLLTLKDHEDINLVEKYKGLIIYKNKEDIKPLKDGYYFRDIAGLDAYVNNELKGKVIAMEEGLKYNFMRVKKNNDNKEVLVPFLDNFVISVDLENKRVNIREMEGLLWK